MDDATVLNQIGFGELVGVLELDMELNVWLYYGSIAVKHGSGEELLIISELNLFAIYYFVEGKVVIRDFKFDHLFPLLGRRVLNGKDIAIIVREWRSQIGPSRLEVQSMIQALWKNAHTMMLLNLIYKMFCI